MYKRIKAGFFLYVWGCNVKRRLRRFCVITKPCHFCTSFSGSVHAFTREHEGAERRRERWRSAVMGASAEKEQLFTLFESDVRVRARRVVTPRRKRSSDRWCGRSRRLSERRCEKWMCPTYSGGAETGKAGWEDETMSLFFISSLLNYIVTISSRAWPPACK